MVKPNIKPTGVNAKNTIINAVANTDKFIKRLLKTRLLKTLPSSFELKQCNNCEIPKVTNAIVVAITGVVNTIPKIYETKETTAINKL